MDLAGDLEPRAFPWRAAALIAAAIAIAELAALLVLAGVKLFPSVGHASPPSSHAATAAHAASKPTAATTVAAAAAKRSTARFAAQPLRPRSRISVLVLNGNGVANAAGDEAAHILSLGYRAATPADASSSSYAHSLVLFSPGYEREGKRLGHDLGIAIVGPLDGLTPSQIKGSQLVVILGDS